MAELTCQKGLDDDASEKVLKIFSKTSSAVEKYVIKIFGKVQKILRLSKSEKKVFSTLRGKSFKNF